MGLRFRLNDSVVYWPPANADKYGRPGVAAPVQLPARWEDKVEETINSTGDVELSGATVYLATDVLVGGLLMLGTLTELGDSGFLTPPRANRRVREIISKGRIPPLAGGNSLVTAYVK